MSLSPDAHRVHLVGGLLLAVFSAPGCRRGDDAPPVPLPAASASENDGTVGDARDSLDVMSRLMRTGAWSEAWLLRDQVLLTHRDDADALTMVANVAFQVGEKALAAELLVEAVQANGYRETRRVQQAVVGLVDQGRVFDAMRLLEDALAVVPDAHALRRMLFEFLRGSANSEAAAPHGQKLVRARQIDWELLKALCHTGRHPLETDSMEQMARRFPGDLRPRLAKATTLVDAAKANDAIVLIQQILEKHPDYLPARMLQGRAFSELGQENQLLAWKASLNGDFASDWRYWLIVGDLARRRGQLAQSARACGEAALRAPHQAEAWTRLLAAHQQWQEVQEQSPAPESDASAQAMVLSEELAVAIRKRVARLAKLQAALKQLEGQAFPKVPVVMQVVRLLSELGRDWEAEAWAAIATTLPEADSVAIEAIRKPIASRLSRRHPWQALDGQEQLLAELSRLPLPSDTPADRLRMVGASPSVGDDSLSLLPQQGGSTAPVIVNEAKARGLTFFGRTRKELDKPGIPLVATLGCGGGAIDFDLDGWPDLFLAAAGGTPGGLDNESNSLWRNLDGQFQNVSVSAKVEDNAFSQGVAVGDVNEDGFADLLVMNYGMNQLLINQGDGTFRNASDALGQRAEAWCSGGAIADLDGDGLSDIVILHYCQQLDTSGGLCGNSETGELRSCAPNRFPAAPDRFYRSRGDGCFSDVTETWQATPTIPGRGLGIVIGSFGTRRGNEVFVANDMSDNHYYRFDAQPTPRLREIAVSNGLATDGRALPQGSMGIAVADFDHDAKPDFYVTNFENEYNTYHANADQNVWVDETLRRGLAEGTLEKVGFGTHAIDFDHDGQWEIIVTNGHIDFPASGADDGYAQSMQIFRLGSDGRYRDTLVAGANGLHADDYFSSTHVGRALWTLDADRDGRTDVVVTHQTEPVALLMNRTASQSPWIAFRLHGTRAARDAVGAVVTVRRGTRSRTLYRYAGGSFLGSSDSLLRVALGPGAEGPIEVTVRWPGGAEEVYENLQSSQEHVLVESP